MWSETEVLTRKKKAPSTFVKDSYPLLTVRRHGFKNSSSVKEHTLISTSVQNAFHIQSVRLKFVPLLLALRILITLQFSSPASTVLHLILKGGKQASLRS